VIDPVTSAALELLGYPYVTPARPGHREVDCCTLAERILHRVYPSAPWSRRTHVDFMISHGDRTRPFSPVDAAVEAGVGQAVDELVAGRWHLVQGWRRLDVSGRIVPGASTGHTFLFLAGAFDAVDGHVLEATNLNHAWWRAVRWADQRKKFDEVRLAVLKTP
jgi:hypothetical protein